MAENGSKDRTVALAEELATLIQYDDKPKPPNWKLSPWAVATYVLGGKLDNGFVVTPKYIGNRRLVECWSYLSRAGARNRLGVLAGPGGQHHQPRRGHPEGDHRARHHPHRAG